MPAVLAIVPSMESKHAKGGRARAEKLSPEDRTRIARDAASARWARDDGAQVVYVIGPKVGPQKVGVAKSPALRRSELQTGSPLRLEVKHIFDPGEFLATQVESGAHRILADSALEGEWFAVTAEEAIAAVGEALERLRRGEVVPPAAPARTPVLVRFDPDQLARVDAFAEKAKVARSVAISTLIDCGLNRPLATRGVVKSTRPHIVGEKPSEQTIKHEPTENALKRQVGFEHHAKQVAFDGPVDVSALAVAGWGENRAKPGSRLKPMKGK